MKQEFLNFLNALIAAAPEVAEQLMTENIKANITAMSDSAVNKPEITDNGKIILKFLQEHQDSSLWKARDIAESLFISSRTVSGAMRKLVSDNFCEKVGENPTIYTLTEKGKNFIIED